MSIEQLYTAPIQQLARFEPLRRFRSRPDRVLLPLAARYPNVTERGERDILQDLWFPKGF